MIINVAVQYVVLIIKPINILGGIHQKYRVLPRTSKPCTLILSLSNSILQYKEILQ
jgi:hypothetical protein